MGYELRFTVYDPETSEVQHLRPSPSDLHSMKMDLEWTRANFARIATQLMQSICIIDSYVMDVERLRGSGSVPDSSNEAAAAAAAAARESRSTVIGCGKRRP